MGILVPLMIAILGLNVNLCMSGSISSDYVLAETCWNSSNLIGMCVPSMEACVNSNGIPVEAPCSVQTEQCCIIFLRIYNCEVESDGSDIYVSSPGYPKSFNEEGLCEVLIKTNPFEERQLRIDFIDFNMTSASNGMCDNDNMTIANLTMCGHVHNQHIYLGLDYHTGSVVLKFSTSHSDYNRAWRIKLSKEMYTNDKPKGCTQYSPHAAGTIYMFNSSLNGPLMSNNSDFKICIKRAQNVCSIVFETCEPLDEPFKIEKSLLFSDDMNLIKLGPFIHSAIPKDTRDGCVHYEQQYCSEML